MRNEHWGMVRGLLSLACAVALQGLVPGMAHAQADTAAEVSNEQAFDIPAGPLADTLTEFGLQSGLQISYPQDAVQGLRSSAVQGRLRPAEALRLLLRDTGMEFSFINASTVLVRPAAQAAPARSGRTRPPASADRAQEEHVVGMPAIMVQGSRTLNMDITRTRDDAQPYVVFEREAIEQSGARSLEDFLRQRLPQNAQGQVNEQSASYFGNLPQINLRGLGTGQTLLLVDGRRMSPTATTGVVGPPYQPDINGIPLAAIERIEVLPTTASGIYGGSATGGVINIITRRDYSGFEVRLSYGNTFDTDVARRRIDVNGGFSLADGRTNVSLAASWSDSNALAVRDRDFYLPGVRRILENDPGQFYNSVWPGATTNIRSLTGADLTLRGSNVSLGSPITHVPVGYAGFASDGGAALLANAGSFNFDLDPSASLAGGSGATLLSQPTTHSVRGTLRHVFTDAVEGFLELAASDNDTRGRDNHSLDVYLVPPGVATNPFNEMVMLLLNAPGADGVMRSFSNTRRGAGGLIFKLPREWMGTAEYTWSEAEFGFSAPAALSPDAATAVGLGLVDPFRDPVDLSPYLQDSSFGERTLDPYVSTQTALSARLSGPMFALPGGKAMLSGLLERREDRFREASYQGAGGLVMFYPDRSQTVDSAYLEATLPFVSEKNARAGLRQLDLQLSVRHDRYEQHGSTAAVTDPSAPILRVRAQSNSTNPTVGLRYSPVEDLMLRASYGTGFMPPAITQLTPSAPMLVPYTDPHRGDEVATFPLTSGGNPDLQPEESESWSVGAVFKPRFVPGLRVSLDYIRLNKTDGISTLQVPEILLLEDYLPGRVVRAPVEPGDPYDVGRIISVDGTSMNLSTAEVEAVDLALDYERPLGDYGSLTLYALGSWQVHNLTRATEVAPLIERVGSGFSNPQKFKGNAGAIWRKDPWSVGWYTRYYGGYRALGAGQGGDRSVSSQIFHDLSVTYRTPLQVGGRGLASWFSDVEYQLGILNVFDKAPAFDADILPFFYSLLGDPRLRSYELSVKVNF